MTAPNGRRPGRVTTEVPTLPRRPSCEAVKLKCFACDRVLKKPHAVYTADDGGQRQFVGPECFQHVVAAGHAGYRPPLGGPRLYAARPAEATLGLSSDAAD